MAKISLTEGFSIIPEGTHIFKITESKYDDDFGKLEVKMITASGQKHSERFGLLNQNGEPNEGAINAFSYFAKTALNNFNLEEIDHSDIVGCYIQAVIEHDRVPSNKDPAKMLTFARMGDKFPGSGFDTAPVASTPSAPKKTANATAAPKGGSVNLDDLLG